MGKAVKTKKSKDSLGDRMKMYEKAYAGEKIMPLVPVCARLDGKNFSKFTKEMERPYDAKFRSVMKLVTTKLVEKASALVGYTQSDEISLIFYSDSLEKQLFFDRKVQKLVSVLTSIATFAFQEGLKQYMPELYGKEALFDCRVWSVPNKIEAVNTLVWRELDATKNSISMAASCYYSHKALMSKTGAERQEMLFQKGINWNDYPVEFKHGTYIMKRKMEIPFTTEELSRLPEKHEARINPKLKVLRSVIDEVILPPIRKIKNKVEVFFEAATPVLKLKENTLTELVEKVARGDLNSLLDDQEFLKNLCLSYRHDFGLLNEEERESIIFDAREWLRSVLNNLPYLKV